MIPSPICLGVTTTYVLNRILIQMPIILGTWKMIIQLQVNGSSEKTRRCTSLEYKLHHAHISTVSFNESLINFIYRVHVIFFILFSSGNIGNLLPRLHRVCMGWRI